MLLKKTLGSFIIATPSAAASCPEPAWALIPPRENFGLRGSKPSCGGGLLPQPTPHQTLPTALTNAANTDLFYQVHGFAMWDFAISTQSCIQTRTWIPPPSRQLHFAAGFAAPRGVCVCAETLRVLQRASALGRPLGFRPRFSALLLGAAGDALLRWRLSSTKSFEAKGEAEKKCRKGEQAFPIQPSAREAAGTTVFLLNEAFPDDLFWLLLRGARPGLAHPCLTTAA